MLSISLFDNGTLIIHSDDDNNPNDNGVILYHKYDIKCGLDSELDNAFEEFKRICKKSYKHKYRM